MKRYRVHDLQGASFMDYSWDEPMTANEIRQTRWYDYLNFRDEVEGKLKYKEFTLDFIQDFWEIRLEEVCTR